MHTYVCIATMQPRCLVTIIIYAIHNVCVYSLKYSFSTAYNVYLMIKILLCSIVLTAYVAHYEVSMYLFIIPVAAIIIIIIIINNTMELLILCLTS